jgi:hypothetical protein
MIDASECSLALNSSITKVTDLSTLSKVRSLPIMMQRSP